MEIIAHGAEAILIQNGKDLIKRRIAKGYRNKEIDARLRKRRNRKEAKLLEKASKIIDIPKIISVNEKETEIIMEFVDGKRLSDCLDDMELNKALKVCEIIGKNIALLHDKGIIHGDLTTSNMILKNDNVFFIDFGLGFDSGKTEDKAVDIHLLRQAFESKHFERWREYYNKVIDAYKKHSKHANFILERLEKVEKRGRYKKKRLKE